MVNYSELIHDWKLVKIERLKWIRQSLLNAIKRWPNHEFNEERLERVRDLNERIERYEG